MMYCDKVSYSNKKAAKKAAKYLSNSKFGDFKSKFSIYHCKECNAWHTYTTNRNQLRHNSQHARGGRRGPRRVRT